MWYVEFYLHKHTMFFTESTQFLHSVLVIKEKCSHIRPSHVKVLQDNSLYVEHACRVSILFAILWVVEQYLLAADDNVLLRPAVAFDILFLWHRQPALQAVLCNGHNARNHQLHWHWTQCSSCLSTSKQKIWWQKHVFHTKVITVLSNSNPSSKTIQ